MEFAGGPQRLSRSLGGATSSIRAAKIATIDAADATKLGRISTASIRKALEVIQRELGIED